MTVVRQGARRADSIRFDDLILSRWVDYKSAIDAMGRIQRDARGGGGGGGGGGGEGGRERREAPAFPSEPPYVAFVGNFPFDASKEDVLATCAVEDASIVRVRPMTDRTQTRVRGYFVEVADAETLREMLKADGVAVGDRPLRVNVAEERRSSLDKGRRHSHDRGQRRNSNQNPRTAAGAAVGDNIVEPAAERKARAQTAKRGG